jgi:hypothetical protein
VRDIEGRAVNNSGPGAGQYTDDRGVFRIYGLPPGTYILFAGGDSFGFNQPTAYDQEAPTYYPSSTRDTAAPVTLRQGEEVSGVDIHYRGEPGHAISGAIKDAPSSTAGNSVELIHAPSNQMMRQQYVGLRSNSNSMTFDFYGVPDGEYFVVARRYAQDEQGGMGRARVKVKGADVTGLEISLTPYSSIAGSVTLEHMKEGEQKNKCEGKQTMSFDETLLFANRDQKTDNKDEMIFRPGLLPLAMPTSKGEFTINSIEAGRYHIEPGSISEDWFIRAVTLPAAAQGRPPVDAARSGLIVRTGDRIKGVTVTIAEGAAALRGRILPSSEGSRLPDRLRVHLVPAEKESADDALRFAETAAQSDGLFTFGNLPPGKYWVVIRRDADEAQGASGPRPVAWDAEGRAKLVKEGEAANITKELLPCQRVLDYMLRFTPAAKTQTKATESRQL